MGWSEVLLWMAGVSWCIFIVTAIRRAQAKDMTVLRHLMMVVAIGAVLWWCFPTAPGAIMVALWLATVGAPVLLSRLMQAYYAHGRTRTAIVVSWGMTVLQPLGPQAVVAAIYRHEMLLELGDFAAAERQAARLQHLPEPLRRYLRLRTLYSERRWAELLAALGDERSLDAGFLRVRCLGELGDLAGMVAACADGDAVARFSPVHHRSIYMVALAFAGHAEALPALAVDVRKPTRDFWMATAWWAAGDEARARAALAAIPAAPGSRPGLFIADRLAHPPAPVAGAGPELRAAIDRLVLATPVVVPPGRPWVTWAIMAACVVMFAATNCFADWNEGLWTLGALDTALDPWSNWWRFIAASFLHVNLPHIAMNLWALWLFGPNLERGQGRWRFSAIYFGAGIGAAINVTVVAAVKHIHPVMVGASGAIMGLIGAELVNVLRQRDRTQPLSADPRLRRIAMIVVLQTMFDSSHAAVSQSGHIGGFISGFIIAWVVMARPRVSGIAKA